jgi:hypothetical protein
VLYLSNLLLLVLEFIFSYLPSTMQQHQDLKLNLLKFITALHVSPYLAIIRCSEIGGGTAVPSALLRSVFLIEVSVVSPPMPHGFVFFWYVRCLSTVQLVG